MLLNCASYTKGSWFFAAGSSVFWGLSVIFTPYIVYAIPLPELRKRNKGSFILGIDTILLVIMLLCIGAYSSDTVYRRTMPQIALFNAGFVWIVFLVCRYIKVIKLICAGIAGMIAGGYIFSINNVINIIPGGRDCLDPN